MPSTPSKQKKVFVAMSGGVDSSVAALLLQRQGYQVTGVFMKNWSDPLADECPWKSDIKDFRKVCQQLGIPAQVETFEEEYRQKVVQYLVDGYTKGITPNPDMLCNREIKFKLFLDKAKSLGADMIATGHYVKKRTAKEQGKVVHQLLRAKDTNKDQSYFLALLTQRQIKDALFPIGGYTKPEIRALAKQAKLVVHDKKDSQGICFIGKVKFSKFIREFIPAKPGKIETTTGETIGTHDGLAFYTNGQRHGLGIGGGTPYYVVDKNIRTNTLVVAKGNKDTSLFRSNLDAKGFNWISGVPQLPLTAQARIRYRQPLQSCSVKKQASKIHITFNRNQRAVTPGQFVVLYRGQQMLGGGVIQ